MRDRQRYSDDRGAVSNVAVGEEVQVDVVGSKKDLLSACAASHARMDV